MPSPAHHDPAALASLALAGDRELRPALLVLQARAFASGPQGDKRSAASFEALALGLIPLVTDDVVADVSAILSAAPYLPERVRLSLQQRRNAHSMAEPVRLAASGSLGLDEVAGLVALERPDVDLVLAENPSLTLGGHLLATLVERARREPSLARALLARPEPSAFHRAALYVLADEPTRMGIRQLLERSGAVASQARPQLSPETRDRLLALAEARQYGLLRSELGLVLSLASAPKWRLKHPAEAELFGLALVACGLPAEDCVQVLLTVHRSLATSVAAVFHLAQLCRTTSPAVAACMVAAGVPPGRLRKAKPPAAKPPAESPQASPVLRPSRLKLADRTRAGEAIGRLARPSSRPASALADHRSRSTKDQGRI